MKMKHDQIIINVYSTINIGTCTLIKIHNTYGHMDVTFDVCTHQSSSLIQKAFSQILLDNKILITNVVMQKWMVNASEIGVMFNVM